MTRLRNQDVADIGSELDRFDSTLQKKTGHTLLEIACHAADLDGASAEALISGIRAAVVPMTCGQGIIEGFAEAVKSILVHLGFHAFVSQHTDAAGIAEAFEKKVDILMIADDNRFVSLVPRNGRVIDNGLATGRGFAAALDFMAGGLRGKKVLVIGCGPVGQGAAEALVHFGATVSAYDSNRKKCLDLAKQILRSQNGAIVMEDSLEHALNNHRFVIEATNSRDVIDEKYLVPEACIAAPGIPVGLNVATCENKAARVFHDPLQTGVATMGLMAFRACHTLELGEEVGCREH